VLATGLLAFAASCTTETEATDQIGVVVTILPQADFVESVGGEKVDVTVMVPPGASPHTYEATPSQMVKVSKAKVYVKVGSGLEFELVWMDKILEQNPNLMVIDCSTGITKMGKDPHIWNSPVNAKKMVENICNGLVAVDLDNKAYYEQNRDNYLQKLDDLDDYIRQRLDGFTNRNFMIYHPAFGYFAAEYSLTQIPIEHEGKEPTPQVIEDCIELCKQHSLSYVFVAPQFATSDAETIASEIGGQTVFVDPLPRLYIANMRSVAGALAVEME
jgi:zinc transport system substrate-binding protein